MRLTSRLTKENKVDLLAFMILAGFVWAVFYHYWQGVYLRQGYPHNTFLFHPGDRFMDFFNPLRSCIDLNPYFGFRATQYPFTSLVFHWFSMSGWAAFDLFCLIVTGAFVIVNALHLRSGHLCRDAATILTFSLLTYPFLFTIDRGNIEGVVFIFLLVFIHFFARRRFYLAAPFLSCAIAMKMFPVVLLALFLPERRYLAAAGALIGAAALTAVSLASFHGGFWANLDYLWRGENLANPLLTRFTTGNDVQRGVSLLTFCKVLFIQYGDISAVNMTSFLAQYQKVAAVAGLCIGAYVWLIEQTLWRRVTLLVFAMLLLPHISADYKLIHLFVPIIVFVDAKPEWGDLWYTILFGLLLIPKGYLSLGKVISDGGPDITINVLLNPAIMLLMAALIVISGTWKRFQPGVAPAFRELRVPRGNPLAGA